MGAIFVADDSNEVNLAVRNHAPIVVGFIKECVHPLHGTLADTRWLPEPDGRADEHDVGIEDLLAYIGPIIPLAFIGSNAWFYEADRLCVEAMLLEFHRNKT